MAGTEVADGPLQPGQPLALKVTKGTALAVGGCLFVAVGLRLAAALSSPASVAAAAAGLVLGYLAADLLSGTVHWFCDTFFSEETPWIGRSVIRPFRDHHRHPEGIVGYRILDQDGTAYFLNAPLLLLLWRRGMPEPDAQLWVLACGAALGFALGSFGTNLFHKWAHAERVPPGVRWLQRRRLILSPAAHAAHHRSYTGGYCVTTGWLNPVLDRFDLFGRLARGVRRLQRVRRRAVPWPP